MPKGLPIALPKPSDDHFFNFIFFRGVAQLVGCDIWDVEAASSSLATPTALNRRKSLKSLRFQGLSLLGLFGFEGRQTTGGTIDGRGFSETLFPVGLAPDSSGLEAFERKGFSLFSAGEILRDGTGFVS